MENNYLTKKELIDGMNQSMSKLNLDYVNREDLHRVYTPYVPTAKQVWQSAFRQFAPYESMSRMFFGEDYVDEENYDPFNDPQIKDAGFDGSMWRFMNSGSSSETAQRIERMKVDFEDQAILGHTDMWFPQLVTSLATPSIMAPLAPLRYLRATMPTKRFKGGFYTSAGTIAPEEYIMAQQLENRTLKDSAMVITTAGLIGGTLSTVLGKYSARQYFNEGPVLWAEPLDPSRKIKKSNESKKPFNPVKDVEFRDLGAATTPERRRQSMYNTMDKDALKETGVGIEKMPWNPVLRLLQSPNALVRNSVAKMIDMGGMIQKKVADNLPMEQSLETTFRTTYIPSLVDTMRKADEAYLDYRGVIAQGGDIQRSFQMIKLKVKDAFKNRNGLSEGEFRSRVAKAVRNNGDTVNDEATAFINRASTEVKKHLDMIKKNAEDVRLFEKQAGKRIKSLEKKIASTTNPTAKARLINQLESAKTYLARLRENGVNVNTAQGYFPRVWRLDKIMDNQEGFLNVVSSWASRHFRMNTLEARKFAEDMMDEVTKSKPFYDIDGKANIDWITNASSTKARSFEIPDNLVDDFLENDIEAVLRHHTKTMGTDIELTRTFGDIDMKSFIKSIEDDYTRLMSEATDLETRRSLKKALENDIRDIKGLRDRLRGTYGASHDPHKASSRFVRAISFEAGR